MSKHNSEHYVLFCHDSAFHTSPSMRHYEVTINGMCKLMHIHTSQWTRTRHIFRFSRSGKREVDVNHNSDYSVIFCHDPFSQLTNDVSSYMKLMHTRTDSPRFDSARNKG